MLEASGQVTGIHFEVANVSVGRLGPQIAGSERVELVESASILQRVFALEKSNRMQKAKVRKEKCGVLEM